MALMSDPTQDTLTCLDDPSGNDCQGDVEYRMALTETGRSYPRCDLHWDARLKEQERWRDYQSDTPPDWFDESYAGERWDEDD
jgi:hypothetical protein